MYVPPPLVHAQQMELVIDALKNDETLEGYLFNDDMKKYFDLFMDSILKGQFQEVDDVSLFIKVNEDSNGLPIYLHL